LIIDTAGWGGQSVTLRGARTLRAASRLVSMLVLGVMKAPAGVDTSVEAARLGARATKAFNIEIMSALRDFF
jgi:hypothetical protein